MAIAVTPRTATVFCIFMGISITSLVAEAACSLNLLRLKYVGSVADTRWVGQGRTANGVADLHRSAIQVQCSGRVVAVSIEVLVASTRREGPRRIVFANDKAIGAATRGIYRTCGIV